MEEVLGGYHMYNTDDNSLIETVSLKLGHSLDPIGFESSSPGSCPHFESTLHTSMYHRNIFIHLTFQSLQKILILIQRINCISSFSQRVPLMVFWFVCFVEHKR